VRGALALARRGAGYFSIIDGHMLVVAVPFTRAE